MVKTSSLEKKWTGVLRDIGRARLDQLDERISNSKFTLTEYQKTWLEAEHLRAQARKRKWM